MSSPDSSRPQVLVLGEALVDVVERSDAPAIEHVGGSPANVAFGLAALDHEVSLATWFGRDDRGRRIIEACLAVGASLVEGSDGAERTSVATAVLDENGAASYEFDITWELPPLTNFDDVGHVHTGSIGAILESGGSQVLGAVNRARATTTISYDPNLRPSLMGSADDVRGRVEALIAQADVVKASDEDIAWLYPDQFVPEVLRHWGTLGPALAVVTRGGEGALFALYSVGAVVTQPAFDTEVADTVGAGDSFMAGLLSGLLDAGLLGSLEARVRLRSASLADVRPAVDRAILTGGITVSRAGAYSPNRTELG